MRRLAATAAASLVAALLATGGQALAEPFSVQGFSGTGQTMDALPGVRFDPATGAVSGTGNCRERRMPYGYAPANGFSGSGTMTECSFGNNFTVTSSSSAESRQPTMHNQFGRQPLTGWETWRP